MPKFLRRDYSRYVRLGRNSRSKQSWRRPGGRDNKMREKRRGYPAIVSIGYGTERGKKELIGEKKPVLVYNAAGIEKIKENEIAVIGKVGKKKKIEIAEKAREKKIKVANLNLGRFLRTSTKSKTKTTK